MAPTGMVGREATVVRMDGMVLLEVEDEAEQVTTMLRTRFPSLTENPTFFPFLWHIPVDVADRVEATTRRTSSSVVDWMAPTVRDHSAGMVGREATVVRMDGMVLLEVEDEAEQATRALRARLAALAENLACCPPFGTYRWMCG